MDIVKLMEDGETGLHGLHVETTAWSIDLGAVWIPTHSTVDPIVLEKIRNILFVMIVVGLVH